MPVWLQFVAAHRIILWLALIYGLLILILSTALYSRAVEITRRVLDAPFVKKAAEQNPFFELMLSASNRINGSTWARVLSIFQGVFLAAVGVTGLLML